MKTKNPPLMKLLLACLLTALVAFGGAGFVKALYEQDMSAFPGGVLAQIGVIVGLNLATLFLYQTILALVRQAHAAVDAEETE